MGRHVPNMFGKRIFVIVAVVIWACDAFVVTEHEGLSSVSSEVPKVGVVVPEVKVGEENESAKSPSPPIEQVLRESEEEVNKKANVTLLDFPNLNATGNNLNHHHQWGRNETGHCNKTEEESHRHADKIEQILWDIFVEDDDSVADEEVHDEETHAEDVEEKSRDDDTDSESTFEDILSDSIAAHNEDHEIENDHKISRRSVDRDEELRSGNPQNSRRRPNNKKSKPVAHSKHRVTSRRHANEKSRSKSKAKNKKSPSNVEKYNEYMDVVLKRMNSMIKTKHMDPLMVNLFSGGNQPNQQNKKKEAQKKNPKKGNTGRKKRKGAKNRARMEESVEARSGSSDSDSGTVELDNEHDGGVQGVGGVFIRRVGVIESEEEDSEQNDDEEEEEDDNGAEEDGERGFREMRALIVNGSMKRSSGDSTTNDTLSKPSPSPSPSLQNSTKSESTTSPQETRGFSNAPTSAESSEESPRKKPATGSGKKKPEKKQNKSKPKKKNGKKTRPTRGVLKGLSSLKRFGNVDVVRQSDNVRIVRGRFTLGPVMLEIVPRGQGNKKKPEVEMEDEEEEERGNKGKKKQAKGNQKESASPPQNSNNPKPKVTAIARELKGIIEIRIKKNSPTTIKRLRVFPPSSVKIKPVAGDKSTPSSKGSSVPRYNRVTPVATHRLRQIASAVVRQADVKRKSSSLEVRNTTPGIKMKRRP